MFEYPLVLSVVLTIKHVPQMILQLAQRFR